MTSSQLELRRERAAHNQSLFREVNERIDELNGQGGLVGGVVQCVCECLDVSCVDVISIPHEEYRRIRRNPTEFLVTPGHEELEVEEVVDQDLRWLVVRKLGAGARLATELAGSQR